MKTLDRIFDLLREERRRYAFYILKERAGPIPLRELATQIAEWETAATEATLEERRGEIAVALLHIDLPRAKELEAIRYDADEQTVELSDGHPALDTILSVSEIIERPGRNP